MFPIHAMCNAFGVSRSGYYAWANADAVLAPACAEKSSRSRIGRTLSRWQVAEGKGLPSNLLYLKRIGCLPRRSTKHVKSTDV
ncbi:MAG TPA: hypothetical protein VGO17_07550 [Aurantimonas sp.]|nr:hypothetical protein [Aurantimonas sp.]